MPIYRTTITVELPVIVHYRTSKHRPATLENPEEPAELEVEQVEIRSEAIYPLPDLLVYLESDRWLDQKSDLEQQIAEHLADSAADYPEPDDR